MPPNNSTGRSHAQIAEHNSRTVLEALRRGGPLTRPELASLVGLTAPGITNIIKRLLAEGLVTESRRKAVEAHIPSAHYALDPAGAFSIGTRMLGERIDGLVIDLAGSILARSTLPRTGDDAGDLASLVDGLAAGLARPDKLAGIGVAYSDRADLDISALRDALSPTPVVGEVDTIAAVLAERTLGVASADSGMVIVLIEEKVRAGLFLHGIPFAGVRGRAGRIGDMRTGADRKLLDEVVSAVAFRQACGANGASGELMDAQRAWVHNAASHLLDAIVALTGFLAPDRVLLAGELPAAIIDALIEEMRLIRRDAEADPSVLHIPAIAPATALHDSVLLGAALLPFFERLLPPPFVRV